MDQRRIRKHHIMVVLQHCLGCHRGGGGQAMEPHPPEPQRFSLLLYDGMPLGLGVGILPCLLDLDEVVVCLRIWQEMAGLNESLLS